MNSPICPVILLVCFLWAGERYVSAAERNVLVFGGNGFIGASVVTRHVEAGSKVTIVSRGNWYWDSATRVKEKVDRFIKCDRKDKLQNCAELKDFVESTNRFDVVYDFSAHNKDDMEDSNVLLKGKVSLYVFLSTGSVYDVCAKKHDEETKETDSTRPDSVDEKQMLNQHHRQGNEKLEAEEVLMAQRLTDDGFPFVIIRLPDVFGPRDTTYRFGIYHLWAKLAPEIKDMPLSIPAFLKDVRMSFVYSEDAARVLVELLDFGPQIRDQAINLAYPEPVTMRELLEEMQEALGYPRGENLDYWPANYDQNFYLYPTIRRGPLDVTKAKSLLNWRPTPFGEAVKVTSDFYEEVMRGENYETQRNEIIQIVGHQLYSENKSAMWDALEKVYNINLNHFRPKEEL